MEGIMKVFSIKKTSGKTRTIYAPSQEDPAALRAILPDLEDIQRKVCIPRIVHGFVKDRSPVTNAMAHRGRQFTLCLDLSSFFDSVTRDKIDWVVPPSILDKILYEGAARQGLPTSPAAANIAAAIVLTSTHPKRRITPMPDPTRFMTIREVRKVILDLKRRAKRSKQARANLVIFRLSCCCGLRRAEIGGLVFTDLVLTGERPCIQIRKENTKGQRDKRRSRKVPLWWDSGTLNDLREWVEYRKNMGATASDPVVCGMSKHNVGHPLTGKLLASRWKTAIRCLGPERVRQLSIHCGRHSFCSLSRAVGRSSIEIRDAVGHANEATTNIYLHAVESENVPDVFAMPY